MEADSCCDLSGRKINFTNSKTLVSRATVTRVTFDLPECKEHQKRKENEKKRKQKKIRKNGKKRKLQKRGKMKKCKIKNKK